MNVPGKIIADYLSPEDEQMDPQEIYKSIEAVQMMVSIRNTDRIVEAIEKLNKTIARQDSKKKSRAK